MALRIRKKEVCRAKGKLFVRLSFSESVDLGSVSACVIPVFPADSQNSGFLREVIAEVYPWGKADGSGLLCGAVVAFPFLECSKADLIIKRSGEPQAPIRIDMRIAKIASPLNYRLRGDICRRISSLDDELADDRLQLRLLRFLEGESGKAIWRMDVTCMRISDQSRKAAFDRSDQGCESCEGDGGNPKRYSISVFDGVGRPVEFKLFPFETQRVDIDGMSADRSIYSLEVPYDMEYFHVVASDVLGVLSDGFCSTDGRFYEAKRTETWEFMKDACASEGDYRKWLDAHRATEESLAIQREESFSFGDGAPLFSIVVPCFESTTEFLSEMMASVVSQSYGRWELILVDVSTESGVVRKCVDASGDERIKYFSLESNLGIVGNTNYGIGCASGDWIAFLDHDDILEPDALYCYAKAVISDCDIDAFFCDEDTFETLGSYRFPVFKSSLNFDLLYSYNCVTHFLAVKRSVLDAIGLSCDEVSGAQDYDLTLRLVAAGKKIHHIPRMLYHWRIHGNSTAADNVDSKPYAQKAGRVALQKYFDLRGIAGVAEDTAHPFVYRMRYATPVPHPLVSIVIPNKDHVNELDGCIRSILDRSSYREFEIVVVENNSEDASTFDYYEKIQAEFEQVKVIKWNREFNYSAIINFGVEHCEGDRLLLLNNDTEVISPDFIPEMLGYLERPEVGVVGAKLFFRDGLVQHAGIEVGPFDVIVHVNQDFTDEREGYRGRATRPGNFSAVTGACQMVRREVFDEVGGYDEDFAVGFNDADFCMRAYKKGYLTVFTPYAKLYHYEFTSRGRESADAEKFRRWEGEKDLFHERWASYFTDGDPFSNPNLSLQSSYYALP